MATNLVTIADYKVYAGITSTNQDALITYLIEKVSALVKKVCRRTFVDYVDDAKVEYHEGGANFIVPEEYPLINVSSVEYSTDFGNTYTSLVEYTDYAVSKASDLIMATVPPFPAGINAYKITYTAGYEEIPEDLKLAVLDLIKYYIQNDAAVHSNKAPGTNSVQIEYITTTNLPAHIKRVLDLYMAHHN